LLQWSRRFELRNNRDWFWKLAHRLTASMEPQI
jgi:hypothetical protein